MIDSVVINASSELVPQLECLLWRQCCKSCPRVRYLFSSYYYLDLSSIWSRLWSYSLSVGDKGLKTSSNVLEKFRVAEELTYPLVYDECVSRGYDAYLVIVSMHLLTHPALLTFGVFISRSVAFIYLRMMSRKTNSKLAQELFSRTARETGFRATVTREDSTLMSTPARAFRQTQRTGTSLSVNTGTVATFPFIGTGLGRCP